MWGRSTKHDPMRCGLAHPLQDEDVLQIVPKTITQQVRVNERCVRCFTTVVASLLLLLCQSQQPDQGRKRVGPVRFGFVAANELYTEAWPAANTHCTPRRDRRGTQPNPFRPFALLHFRFTSTSRVP